MAKRTRPTYSAPRAELICQRLALGESLRAICRDMEIDHSTVLRWVIADHEGFADQYARARECQAELHVDELIELSDADPEYVIETRREEGSEAVITEKRIDPAWVAQQKLRIDTRKWAAAKMRPTRYGERVDLNHKGGMALNLTIDMGPNDE